MRHRKGWWCPVAIGVLVGCSSPSGSPPPVRAETWSVTAWGERFEVFSEVEALVAGQVAVAHTHVTRLDDFSPVAEGGVEIVLAGATSEQIFAAAAPTRVGIFAVDLAPRNAGEADVIFRISDAGGSEEIRGGRFRVGTAEDPGSLVRAPAPRGGSDGGESQPFLKEEQWKSAFATAWVREGRVERSVAGLATFRPPAGGEITVTAPIDGVVRPLAERGSWPFVGLSVERGAALFRLVPRVAPGRSLPNLEAELATLSAELETARARRGRLEELLALEATSERETEEARVREESLGARHRAAELDLASARASRGSGAAAVGLALDAPFSGEVAAVGVTPGATVAAGDSLARLVRTDVVWIEVALPASEARLLASAGARSLVLEDGESEPVRIDEGLSLVSIAPELSPRTGTLTVLLEAPSTGGFALGSTVAAQVLSAKDRTGIVVPASALVDDGGVSIVYLQLAGESFVRQQVTVVERQGERVLVEGLVAGQRLVTRGGDALRRSSLMAGGDAHGHVH